MVTELTKIAIIHLYVQGFTDEDLVDFELSLTNPSVIYEQEKLNLWKEKVGVATQIMESKMLSQDWVYHNILELSEDEIITERKKIIEDVKRMSELTGIEQQAGQPTEAPPEELPAGEPDSQAAPEQDQQIDDVNTILSSLEEPSEESELEIPEEELEEAKMGRPREGMKFGQDSGKPGYKYGDSGKCYTYTPNDAIERNKAKRQAIIQGIAIGEYAEIGERGGIKKSDKAPKSDTPNPNPKGEGTAKGSASTTRGAEVTQAVEDSLRKKVTGELIIQTIPHYKMVLNSCSFIVPHP